MDTVMYLLQPVFTTIAVIGVVTVIVLALKAIDKMFPASVERFKDMTPWMGWYEEEPQTYYNRTPDRRPSNRW